MFRVDPIENRVDVFLAHAFRLVLGPVSLAAVNTTIPCLMAGGALLVCDVSRRLGAAWVGAGDRIGRHRGWKLN